MSIQHDFFNIDIGLIRVARGFGYSFSPTDLFNPRNPINLSARPDGQLGILAKFYPMDFWRIELFALAPENPINSQGWGWKFGNATNFYLGKINFEFLYSFFLPEMEFRTVADPSVNNLPEYTNNDFSHIVGFSLKADIEIALFIDMIYRFNQQWFYEAQFYDERNFYGYEGLEAAIGFDYTIKGKVYILAEYLFYGPGALDWAFNSEDDDFELDRIYNNTSDSQKWEEMSLLDRYYVMNTAIKPQHFLRHNYLFGMVRVTVNDFLNISTSYLFGIEDQSGLLNISFDVEPISALNINISAKYPFDWHLLNKNWRAGEFGPNMVGFYQDYQISCKIEF
ncbi:MAG: hypothetical protein MJB14_10790 [Spirochaetes bacterium]|nr:hypothetical protein [Spirochaetota bacterium]